MIRLGKGGATKPCGITTRAKALIGLNKPDEVLQLISEAISKFPKQKKILLRLKAVAFYRLGQLPESRECYKDLCSGRKS